MASDGKVYALEIEWCNVKQALAGDPNPATQVLREPYDSLQVAFNIMGHVNKDLFDPVKVDTTGLPAFVKSVGLYENDQLIMYRSNPQPGAANNLQMGAGLMIPAHLLTQLMVKAIGGVLTSVQTKHGQILPLQPASAQKAYRRQLVRQPARTARQRRRR